MELKHDLYKHTTPLWGNKQADMESQGILSCYEMNLQISKQTRGCIDSKRLKLFITTSQHGRAREEKQV
jgi:hypothetical protein